MTFPGSPLAKAQGAQLSTTSSENQVDGYVGPQPPLGLGLVHPVPCKILLLPKRFETAFKLPPSAATGADLPERFREHYGPPLIVCNTPMCCFNRASDICFGGFCTLGFVDFWALLS